MDRLRRIKLLVEEQRVHFSVKARSEMYEDSLSRDDVYESILNASAIVKTLRSRNPITGDLEKLHVIKGLTAEGVSVYTKGRISSSDEEERFYVLVSSKRDTDG